MRLNKILALISIIMLLFLLWSCDKGGSDLNIEISPLDKSLLDLATTIYDESQLSKIVKFNGSIDELNDQYPIECLRKDNDTYRVAYLGDGSIVVLLFDNYGNRLFGHIYNTQLLKSDFEGLIKGQSLEEVRRIDPNGEYLFLYTGRNDTPKVSSHYTKDGYLITIEYDISNIIISINEKLI
ncbi:MAG: hypothetical protein IJX51_06845 [Clostridia bacterium]|nr:hypothetical protein [Clostridia bacterium]